MVLAVYALAFFALGGAASYLLNENTNRIEDTTTSLVTNCEQNGNPLRAAIRTFGHTQIKLLEDQNTQAESFSKAGAYHDLFPNFPKAQLNALIAEGIAKRQEAIALNERALRAAMAVDCEAKFK